MANKEYTNDPAAAQAAGTFKLDGEKPPVYRGFIAYFPRAIEAVAGVSAFGQRKYGTWGGWRGVDDGDGRYSDAEVRHLLGRAKGEVLADDSRLTHLAHKAWNAMAVLELFLEEQEKEDEPA